MDLQGVCFLPSVAGHGFIMDNRMISSFDRGSFKFSVLSLTDVGVLGGRESAVGALGAAKSEFEQLDLRHVAGGDAVARRVRRYQTGDDKIYLSICDIIG